MPFVHKRPKVSRSQYLENLAKKQGLRHAIFSVLDDRYIGEWDNNIKSGKGALLTRFRELYEGDFLNNLYDGFGVLSHELPCKVFILDYRGWWKKGKMHGFGMKKYRDGGLYLGSWRYGKRHGYAWMWYPNGDFFAGSFARDMRDGIGMLVSENLNRYEGNWKKDMKHGKGKYIHLDSGQIQHGIWHWDNCAFSTIKDIRYRQTSPFATKYPIWKLELLNIEEICSMREMQVLEGKIKNSCISLISNFTDEEQKQLTIN